MPQTSNKSGDACSVTEGVVSRVEVQEYSHSLRFGLALTVDAAINRRDHPGTAADGESRESRRVRGNSGGPLVDALSGHVVGVAFQKMVARGVELQGHAVPAPVIQRFLEDVASSAAGEGSPVRLKMPSLGCDYQSLEPPALRQSLGLDELKGILISRLHHADPGRHATGLAAGDVLLTFNGHKLDELGFADLFGRRLHFGAARDLCRVGSAVEMEVWRGGARHMVQQVLRPAQHLVPRGQYDVRPRFFIVGGLVFQALSTSPASSRFIHFCASSTPRHEPIFWLKMTLAAVAGASSFFVTTTLVKRYLARKEDSFAPLSEKLTQRLTSVINAQLLAVFSIPLAATLMARGVGYVEWLPWQVNGTAVRNLSHFVQLVEAGRQNHALPTGGDGGPWADCGEERIWGGVRALAERWETVGGLARDILAQRGGQRRERAAAAAERRTLGPSAVSTAERPQESRGPRPVAVVARSRGMEGGRWNKLNQNRILSVLQEQLGIHRLRYVHEQKPAIVVAYVPLQRHLVTYLSFDGVSEPLKATVQVGMPAAAVYAKIDYLLLYPLLYRQCVPALTSIPPEALFGFICGLSIPSLASLGCSCRAMSASDLVWLRVVMSLPSEAIQAEMAAVKRREENGEVLPKGIYKGMVRTEVRRLRQEAEQERRRREEALARQRSLRDPLQRPRRLEIRVLLGGGPFRIVLPLKGLDEADERIQRIYGLPRLGSETYERS
eukprot:g23517.t1